MAAVQNLSNTSLGVVSFHQGSLPVLRVWISMGLCTKPMAMIAMPTSKALSNPIKSQSSHTNRLKGEGFYQELGNASSFNQSLGNPSIAVLPIILQTELTLAVSPSLFTGLHQTYKNKSCICSVCEVHLKIPNEKSPKICCGFPPTPKNRSIPFPFASASQCTEMMSAPALAKSSTRCSGSTIIRWQSSTASG